ncbi:kinase-like domain-containing protein [Camillea tinctor]|nr:kinase-like domain-containing protein [Camillea tinctor]
MASDRTNDTSVSRLIELASPLHPNHMRDDEIEYYPMDSAEGIEDVELYNQGGFHPVHLGDVLDGRFEVVHKLGHGGFGTVWLCQDVKRHVWRAVKIMTADHSAKGNDARMIEHLTSSASSRQLQNNHLNVPQERFWIEGPNGRHLCLVREVFGWNVGVWSQQLNPLEDDTAGKVNDVCRQITQGLRFLHSRGICHGDLRPPNILMKLQGLDKLSKSEVLELTGEPELVNIQTMSGKNPRPHAPKHCVVDVDPYWCKSLSSNSVAIIDFGESFRVETPPETTGIPTAYGAPEILFEGVRTPGFPSDVWSLACTMYEIKTRDILFGSRWGAGINMTMGQMAQYLGPVPGPYQAAYQRQLHAALRKSLDEARETGTSATELPTKEAKDHPDAFERDIGAERQEETVKYRYPERDIVLFPDLLKKMLKYDPDERISTDGVFFHPWIGGLPAHLILYNKLKSIPMTTYIQGFVLFLLFTAVLYWILVPGRKPTLLPVTVFRLSDVDTAAYAPTTGWIETAV